MNINVFLRNTDKVKCNKTGEIFKVTHVSTHWVHNSLITTYTLVKMSDPTFVVQAEHCSMVKDYTAYENDLQPTDLPKGTAACVHEWKEYNSGWTLYEYCVKCDIQKQENV